jgi:hypothetical protein
MGMISRNRHSLQTRVLAGLLVALPGQMVLPSFYSQAHAQQLASQENAVLAKAVQEDSIFQGSHNEVSDLSSPMDTSTTTGAVSSDPSLPATEPAEATEQGPPLRRRGAAGVAPQMLAQAGATSGGGTSTSGGYYTGGLASDNTRTFFQGLTIVGFALGGSALGLAISESGGGNHTTNNNTTNITNILSGSR